MPQDQLPQPQRSRRIFLSSTQKDLRVHRLAVHDILERLGQFAVDMAQFNAQGEGDAVNVSLEQVQSAEVYIGLVAWRYGYVPLGETHSVTHREYLEARRLGRPCFLFLAEASTEQDEGSEALFPANLRDAEHTEQVHAFRAELERDGVVDYFTTPDNLAKKVATALHEWLLKQQQVETPQQPTPKYQTTIHNGKGTVIGEGNIVINHFSGGISILSTDYASRIQNFLTEYLGTPDQPVPFGGRDADLARLDAWLEDPKAPPYALLAAPAGRGKSALLVQWTQRLLERQDLAVVFFPISIRFRTNLATVVFPSLVARLATLHGEPVPTSPNTSVEVWRDLVHQYLSRPLLDGKRLVLVLDALDEAAWEVGPDLFPSVLSPGMRVLVSARFLAGDADARAWLRRLGWERLGRTNVLALETLSQEGLVEVLRSMGAPLDQLGNQWTITQELFRLTEGDPLLIRLYVEALWEQHESALQLQPEDLSQLRPGLEGYFARWWEEQQKLWGKRTLFNRRVEEVLRLLACALGPLNLEDLLHLASPKLKLTTLTLKEALRPLQRLVIGDGQQSGYVFSHPRLATYFYEENLSPSERQQIEARFLHWGAETLAAVNTGQLPPDQVPPYLLQYYGAHLERNRADVSLLLTLMSQGWLRAWERFEGTFAGFLQDVARAWRAAERRDERATHAEQPAPYLGEEVRCALCWVSVNSLATNIPPDLVLALVREHCWTGAQGLAYARQVVDSQKRAEDLTRLVPLLNEPLKNAGIETALIAIEAIRDEWDRAKALIALAPVLPRLLLSQALEITQTIRGGEAHAKVMSALVSVLPEEQQQPVLRVALREAQTIKDEEARAEALNALARVLPEEQRQPVLEAALQATKAINHGEPRTRLLRKLVPLLPELLLPQALEAAQAIEDGGWRALALIAVARVLPKGQQQPILTAALEATQTINKDDERGWANVLGRLAPLLSEEQRQPVLAAALKQVQAIENKWIRTEVLITLAPVLSAPLVPQTLEIVQAIGGEDGYRARMLGILAPLLSEEQRQAVLADALAEVCQIENDWSRSQALYALVPVLPNSLLSQAFEAAQAIKDDVPRLGALGVLMPVFPQAQEAALQAAQAIKHKGHRAELLLGLADRLPEEQRQPALVAAQEAAQYIGDARSRAYVLMELSQVVPEAQRQSILAAALAAAQAIETPFAEGEDRAQVLSALARVLPEEQRRPVLATALEAAQTIENEGFRAVILSALTPMLPEPLLPQALEAAQAIKDSVPRARVLSALMPVLPEPLLPMAVTSILATVQAIKDAVPRTQVLRALVTLLPEEQQQPALKAALASVPAISEDWYRVEVLRVLAPVLPDSLLPQALEAALGIADEMPRARALRVLASVLPEPLLPQALEAALQITDEASRAEALSALALLLPELQRFQILEATQGIADEKARAETLRVLAPALPESLLPRVLEATLAINNEGPRREVLTHVMRKSAGLPRQTLYSLWRQFLRHSTERTRPDFLADLAGLVPLLPKLGAPEAATQVFAAIQEACRWWS